jgi:glycosyltransferase involved in cell wall biosynthesis
MVQNSRLAPDSPEILYVIGGLDLGGSERHLSRIVHVLADAGWKISVYSLAGDGPLRSELEQAGIRVNLPPIGRKGIGGSSLLGRAFQIGLAGIHLTAVMIRRRPQVVHFFLPSAYIIGSLAAMVARVRVRVMSRRSLNVYQNRIPGVRRIEGCLHRTMSAVLGNSNAVMTELRDEGVPGDRIALIYNGISPDERNVDTRAETRSAFGVADETLVFIIVANLIPYKGHLDLIEALGMAHGQIGTAWRLLIVGRDDGVGPAILAAAKRHAIEDSVLLLGSRTDVSALLSASDVGVLCSHEEGFSNAVLEGMAAGLPMIVSDVGGNGEAVLAGRTGCVVPPRDPEALAEAIVRLAHDVSLRMRYGMSGRARIEEKFTLDVCVAKYVALYRGLMDGRLPRDIVELQDQRS